MIGLYNYVNFGDPLRGTEQLYLHASSLLTEFSYPLDLGAYLNLFSPYRGLFVYSIFLVIGVFGFYEMMKRSTYKQGGHTPACVLSGNIHPLFHVVRPQRW